MLCSHGPLFISWRYDCLLNYGPNLSICSVCCSFITEISTSQSQWFLSSFSFYTYIHIYIHTYVCAGAVHMSSVHMEARGQCVGLCSLFLCLSLSSSLPPSFSLSPLTMWVWGPSSGFKAKQPAPLSHWVTSLALYLPFPQLSSQHFEQWGRESLVYI